MITEPDMDKLYDKLDFDQLRLATICDGPDENEINVYRAINKLYTMRCETELSGDDFILLTIKSIIHTLKVKELTESEELMIYILADVCFMMHNNLYK